ncbi:hypothetical protein [Granulicella sp. S190]|uniref:hypothetical protein n=1 Tax=Granulicella sp. S190 TaxID=1747226 RepID=UPI0015762C89|nr:hypothetical protein [Granulicella sp. S190]
MDDGETILLRIDIAFQFQGQAYLIGVAHAASILYGKGVTVIKTIKNNRSNKTPREIKAFSKEGAVQQGRTMERRKRERELNQLLSF